MLDNVPERHKEAPLKLQKVKKFLFVDSGVFLAAALLACAALSLAKFIDWSGPADDLTVEQREQAANCLTAWQVLGDGILNQRPDCREPLGLPPRSIVVARQPSAAECQARVINKPGGDDGLDTCGYPGMPPCMSTPPPGCP